MYRPLLAAVVCLLAMPAIAQPVDIEVRVDGITGSARDNVRAFLSIVRYRELPELTDTMVTRLHARAPDEIRQALRPFGYYAPEIQPSLEHRDGRWHARYRIALGAPVLVRSVDISVTGVGRDDEAFRRPDSGLRIGQRLHHPAYEEMKQHLLSAASNRGYLDARFTRSELRVSVEERAADVVLHFDTGHRYRFGPITIEQDILRDDFVRRYVQFEEGEPFNVGRLLELQFALSDSEYFRLVEVDAQREAAIGDAIPVTVRMEGRERHRYTAGAGFATDTGARLLLGYENRRVNQRGHRWLTDVELAQMRQIANTRYVIPLDNPTWDRLTVAGALRQEELGDVDLGSAELLVAHTTRPGRWQRTYTGRLSREREEVGGTSTLITQFVPSADWLFSRPDAGFRPRSGWRINLGLAASGPVLGAPTEFVQVRGRFRWVMPVGELNRLILRTELGATAAGDPDRLPVSQRFFAGGDHSVRGYRYQTLGSTDADGNVIGGRYLATFSAEYEHWFTERWGVGTFVDSGNAFMGRGESTFTGAGIGLRVGLPFALIALDFAHPFDDAGGRAVRLHLTLGGDP